MTCLYNLAHQETGFPPLADNFLNTVLFQLPSLQSTFKVMALELLTWRAAAVPRLFQELQSKDLLGMIRHRDFDMQLAVAQLLKTCANTFKLSQINYLYPALSGQNDNLVFSLYLLPLLFFFHHIIMVIMVILFFFSSSFAISLIIDPETFIGHPELRCRSLFYDICMILYDRKARVAAGELMDDDDDEFDHGPFFDAVRISLLQGGFGFWGVF